MLDRWGACNLVPTVGGSEVTPVYKSQFMFRDQCQSVVTVVVPSPNVLIAIEENDIIHQNYYMNVLFIFVVSWKSLVFSLT